MRASNSSHPPFFPPCSPRHIPKQPHSLNLRHISGSHSGTVDTPNLLRYEALGFGFFFHKSFLGASRLEDEDRNFRNINPTKQRQIRTTWIRSSLCVLIKYCNVTTRVMTFNAHSKRITSTVRCYHEQTENFACPCFPHFTCIQIQLYLPVTPM